MTAFTLRGYAHGDLLLNLSGTRDEDGCDIERITVDGSEQNLFDLFTSSTLRSMEEATDAQLSNENSAARGEQRAELRQWHRDMLRDFWMVSA